MKQKHTINMEIKRLSNLVEELTKKPINPTPFGGHLSLLNKLYETTGKLEPLLWVMEVKDNE